MERGSELLGGEQPPQPGVDAGEALLGAGGGVAGGAAEGRGGGQGGAPPQLAHRTAERREIGPRALARARKRRSGCAAGDASIAGTHEERV